MNDVIDFLKPRFDGKRFTDHSLPLDVLKDLAVFNDLIAETAKWLYLQENLGRKRIPKGFLEDVSLKLVGIEEGSAIPKIIMIVSVTSASLFPPASQLYFEKARDAVIAAVDAAENHEDVAVYLPDNLLGFFDRLGRSLEEDECIEFAPERPARPARLSRESRRSLILASAKIQKYTEEVTLRGLIPEADQEKNTFTLALPNGQRIPARFNPINGDKILEAFGAYLTGQKVMVRGVGIFARNGKLQELESSESVMLLDPLDVPTRLDELSALRDGWLDGDGVAPDSGGLEWFGSAFERYYDERLSLPRLYPTAEGGIQAEWSKENHQVSLEIDLRTKKSTYQAVDTVSLESSDFAIDLDSERGWKTLNEALAKVEGLIV